MPVDTLSPVSTLCLAILHRGEATGYEIKKASVEGDYRYFVDASYGSIYPALARLAADGFVTVREETQAGRPSRKVYAITNTGRDALIDALSQHPGTDLFRSRFLLVAKFAADLPQDVVRAAIEERRQNLMEEIRHLERIASEDKVNEGVAWITGYGRTCMGASLDYLDRNAESLIAMARHDVADAAE
ncbi:PadR family transcriptional regulator [Acuticoccus kandeliae]|uniref:PadR family transcriptional regulator n=1 Tax=Acuticoccus kandeliae TaxID=2073160 RepID=UPI001FE755A2|nr:PadR family transcriptional regulator [Acuticoccus kandeliae]